MTPMELMVKHNLTIAFTLVGKSKTAILISETPHAVVTDTNCELVTLTVKDNRTTVIDICNNIFKEVEGDIRIITPSGKTIVECHSLIDN